MSSVRLLIPLLLCTVGGCAELQQGPGMGAAWSLQWPFTLNGGLGAANGEGAAPGYAAFNFDWQLSGDPQVMPLQVFDDGAGMWLQFVPDGAWPAVFEVTASGWRPLSYRSDGPYMVLDAVYEHLAVRGGHLQGDIRRKSGALNTASVSASSAVPVPLPPVEPAVPGLTHPPSTAPAIPGASGDPAGRAFLGAPLGRYNVSPADSTMRQALERWARTAGWAFNSDHWDVDVDIPLVGEASFHTDFKSAVRDLLAATEMSDRPLQPCFYSNRVLRVVSHAQACDRRGKGLTS